MIHNLLLAVLILTIPSNLFLKFGLEQSYVNGLQIDYLLPKLFVSDIVLLLLLMVVFAQLLAKSSWSQFKQKLSLVIRNHWLTITIWLLILAYQFTTSFVLAGIYFWLKLTLMASLFTYLLKKQLNSRLLTTSLGLSLVAQTAIAGYQFFSQQPLFPYRVLGEPSFRPYYRLSRQFLLGKERILAYGTTAHPNVLAGLGVIFCLMLWQSTNHQQFKPALRHLVRGLSLVCSLVLIFMAQSWTALATLILGILLMSYKRGLLAKKFSKKILLTALIAITVVSPLLITVASHYFPDNPSWQRRNHLHRVAVSLWHKQPWLGIGLNQFAGRVEQDNLTKVVIGFVQPTHHIGLLWLAETGVLGVALAAVFFAKIKINKQLIVALLVISPLLILDHYLYTLQTGQLLVVWWLAKNFSSDD
jgi:hypothetical protein